MSWDRIWTDPVKSRLSRTSLVTRRVAGWQVTPSHAEQKLEAEELDHEMREFAGSEEDLNATKTEKSSPFSPFEVELQNEDESKTTNTKNGRILGWGREGKGCLAGPCPTATTTILSL